MTESEKALIQYNESTLHNPQFIEFFEEVQKLKISYDCSIRELAAWFYSKGCFDGIRAAKNVQEDQERRLKKLQDAGDK